MGRHKSEPMQGHLVVWSKSSTEVRREEFLIDGGTRKVKIYVEEEIMKETGPGPNGQRTTTSFCRVLGPQAQDEDALAMKYGPNAEQAKTILERLRRIDEKWGNKQGGRDFQGKRRNWR